MHDYLIPGSADYDSTLNFYHTYQPGDSSSKYQDVVIEMYDVLGNLVIHKKHEVVNGTNILKTNVENIENGIYFVRLIDADNNVIYTERLVKQ